MKKSEEELPDHEIEVAEERKPRHHHDALHDDDALRGHLQRPHGLDAPEHLSRATLEGLHDRLHDETDTTTKT